MDDLRGPTIQIILHLKEGLGFGFVNNSFIVSASLNGYILETDPMVPCHAPVFDAELVWEADKRRFRNLRIQNVPIKMEVFTTGTQGRKDKVGYILLSLLGAQPCPANKIVDVKYVWHKLLGVKSEGKCCHPQLLMSLSIEDRMNNLTPRNELRLFHSNEIAYLSCRPPTNPPTERTRLQTISEYLAESKKTVTSIELQPKLMYDEGLIQIGSDFKSKYLFLLSFAIGSAENVDLLLPEKDNVKEAGDCFVTYSVFTHDITTDRVPLSTDGQTRFLAAFNQRTSLRLLTELSTLSHYFLECSYVIVKLCLGEKDIGLCSMDLRKLVPTDSIKSFLDTFCNTDKSLTINERCYILSYSEKTDATDNRKAFIDIEMSLKYIGMRKENMIVKPNQLSARSATQIVENNHDKNIHDGGLLGCKSTSCTQIDPDVCGVTYTNITACNTSRYKNAAGDSTIQCQNEIADIIRKMCDSFTLSQEKLLASKNRPSTSDMQIQCELIKEIDCHFEKNNRIENTEKEETEPEMNKCEHCHHHNIKDAVKSVIPQQEREALMQKFVDELEDWKDKQQELHRFQLKQKEEYHLDLLSKEWFKKRMELETKLSRGIEQCRNLAADLSRATEDFRLRGFRNTEREKKLMDAKKALEQHYTSKFQELREASQKMEDDMNHRLKLKDMEIEEFEAKVQHLEKQIDILKTNMRNIEKEAENKYSGLTKDQTASLIQELRCLEEKLDNAVQSKAFFKEQWGRAVRELHFIKLNNRRQMLTQLKQERQELSNLGLDTPHDKTEEANPVQDINRLKDDYYLDILANTPALESHTMLSTETCLEEMDMFADLKTSPRNLMNEKLNDLIVRRDKLVKEDNPDEEILKQLNHDIRSILLKYGS